ncbi:DEAD/DEAH box helicase [Gemmatimonas phototrophica]|uniref:Helicase n=1 Tax=Gemmatimonas phototrophica TaxID=1379270 RepID=A0A143BKS1_9BACT|nr:DEAD/DEAH box helicase [Gemmatimonas phototrophica]AMW05639.1 hypothetical protein GEMMAAP_14160 [Gemmatimonas phototrophica]
MIDRSLLTETHLPDRPGESAVPDRVRAIRRRMALAILPPLPSPRLGTITLLTHQQQAAARLLRMLAWHRGALLADDVGLGKTFTALAVAQRYQQVHVLAPAALVPMWQGALLRSQQAHITVHSLHRFSRRTPPPVKLVASPTTGAGPHPLIIVDEAHALRNPSTLRYRHLAAAVAGCHVLLISATPLHNSPRDLHALFALFRGQQADTLRPDVLSSLIVRRDQALTHPRTPRAPAGRREQTTVSGAIRPDVHTHRALVVPQDRRTLDLLLALPAPLPAHDGAVAGALIRLGLLRAWCSSDAALAQVVTRRIQRGSAMRDALHAGRHPTNAELRAWVLGDDGGTEMQLGFPELLVQQTAPDMTANGKPPLVLLDRHLEALRLLRDHHAATAQADAVRAAMLRTVRERHAGVSVVAFSQYSRTVQALYRALSDIAGVGLLTGSSARIASGAVSRTELLEHFAPRAHGRPPPPTHQAVTLLLTTDLIAEGVNLQDAGVIVHLDLPWTYALRTQRTGRVARLGSRFRVVHEYRVQAAAAARRALRAETRVARKAALTARYVGGIQSGWSGSSRVAVSAADVTSQWLNCLDSWMQDAPVAPQEDAPWLAVQTREGTACTALVLTTVADGHTLLALMQHHGRWRVSSRPAALLRVAEMQRQATPLSAPSGVDAHAWGHRICRVVHQWHVRQNARRVSGLSAHAPNPDGPPLAPAQRRAMAWLLRIVSALSTVHRQQYAHAIAAARACIEHAYGTAAERALTTWMQTGPSDPTRQLLAWREFDVLVRGVPTVSTRSRETVAASSHSGGDVLACLLYIGVTGESPP